MSEETHTDKVTTVAYLIAILFLPLLVLWWQDNLLFTPGGCIDPWTYFGYFRNLTEFKRSAPGLVSGTHLSWILPAAGLHSVFDAESASRLLHLGVELLAAISLFDTLRWLTGLRQAFLSVLLFSTYPSVWMATGWDFNDGIAIAYCLLTFALLTRAAVRPGRRIALFAAGMALAALFYSSSEWVVLAPLLPLYYVGMVHLRGVASWFRSLLHLCCWMLPGFLLVTAVLCAINYSIEGRILFYAGPVIWALHVNTPPAPILSGLWSNGAPSPWLLLPSGAAAVALLVLTGSIRRKQITAPSLFAGLFLGALAWLVLEQLRGGAPLAASFHVSALLPFAFLLVGAIPSSTLDGISRGRYLLLCWLAAMALSYALQFDAAVIARDLRATGWLAIGALVAYLLWKRPLERLACLVAAFWLFSAVVAGQATGGLAPHAYRRHLEAVNAARARIEVARRGLPVRFWFRSLETDDAVALSSSYVDAPVIGDQLPTPPCDAVVLPSTVIAAITTNSGYTSGVLSQSLSECWQRNGLRAVPIETDTYVDNNSGFRLMLLRVETIPGVWTNLDPVPRTTWRSVPGEAAASSLRLVPEGLLVHTGVTDAVSATAPAIKATAAGRYVFSLVYWPGLGGFRFGLIDPAGYKWLALAGKPLWNGENYQIDCWADLQSGQEVQLAIANAAGQTRPAWFLLKQVNQVRVNTAVR